MGLLTKHLQNKRQQKEEKELQQAFDEMMQKKEEILKEIERVESSTEYSKEDKEYLLSVYNQLLSMTNKAEQGSKTIQETLLRQDTSVHILKKGYERVRIMAPVIRAGKFPYVIDQSYGKMSYEQAQTQVLGIINCEAKAYPYTEEESIAKGKNYELLYEASRRNGYYEDRYLHMMMKYHYIKQKYGTIPECEHMDMAGIYWLAIVSPTMYIQEFENRHDAGAKKIEKEDGYYFQECFDWEDEINELYKDDLPEIEAELQKIKDAHPNKEMGNGHYYIDEVARAITTTWKYEDAVWKKDKQIEKE